LRRGVAAFTDQTELRPENWVGIGEYNLTALRFNETRSVNQIQNGLSQRLSTTEFSICYLFPEQTGG
jgi:hypothetical protein